MGEDGQTTVQELISIAEEDYYNKIITNVAIGAGVILVCVVITVATEGAGAPAAPAPERVRPAGKAGGREPPPPEERGAGSPDAGQGPA